MRIAKPATIAMKQSSDPVQIAVIGGGPKAAAIAAKAWVLREEKKADVRVTIFEPDRIGAYWFGKAGYTDGDQRLCTIAERDVGYPYNSMFGNAVDVAMSAKFSWGRFLHTRPPGYETGYSTWIDAGRKPPLHKHYADYLRWVVSQTLPQTTVVKRRVSGLNVAADRWLVDSIGTRGSTATHSTQFDAVVVTGPGPAKKVSLNIIGTGALTVPRKIFNGQDFWQRISEVRKCLREATKDLSSGNAIVIIGAGGTAAAILAWLVTEGAGDLPIQMVASQASLYTRVDSVFENQLFSDEAQWETLSSASRRAFFDRLNRGVVWATVIDRVASARQFKMIDGRAQQVVVASSTDIRLEVLRGDGTPVTLQASMLIDCSGFDAWWFLSLINGFPGAAQKDAQERQDRWQREMDESLKLLGTPWDMLPALHAPMLSSERGPGFGSLMVLGAMADRVLRSHSSAK